LISDITGLFRWYGHHGYRHHKDGREGGRAFDYGELLVLVLEMVAEQPRHGYELMRAIEQRMGGSYSPSPGVIYPTLSWLEDSGYAQIEPGSGTRKRYLITAEGTAFLTTNRAAIDDMLARIGSERGGGRHEGTPAPVIRGMENLKLALRLRLKGGPLDRSTVDKIAAALDAAAQAVERA
jgi:DNA-binding PadR family transcriptional regulator